MPRRETEVKIRVCSLSSLRSKLKRIGLVRAHGRMLEDNVLFDTPDRALRRERRILRLRQYGKRWSVTYKGTPASDPLYKSRIELETEVADPQALRAIFDVLGLQPVFRYQKFREQFAAVSAKAGQRAAIEVALDETPIGDYMELEGSRAAIDRVAARLGFSRQDYSTASYGALYLEDCRKRNVPAGDMIFSSARRGRDREKLSESRKSESRKKDRG